MNSRIVYAPSGNKFSPKRRFFRINRKRSLLIAAAVAVFLCCTGGLIYLTRLPYFQLQKVDFSGVVALNENELKEKVSRVTSGSYAALFPKNSLLLLSSEKIAENLQSEFPLLKNVEVKKEFPDKLKIAIEERKMWGVFCPVANEENQNPCAYLDQEGFIYELAPNVSGSLILKITSDAPLTIGSRVFEPDFIKKLIFLGEEAKKATGAEVTEFILLNRLSGEIRLKSAEGYTIYLNSQDDFANVFKVLKTVLNEEIKKKRKEVDYIDLRLGNKVFYKFKQVLPLLIPPTQSSTATSTLP